jgi:hypothetical protein
MSSKNELIKHYLFLEQLKITPIKNSIKVLEGQSQRAEIDLLKVRQELKELMNKIEILESLITDEQDSSNV